MTLLFTIDDEGFTASHLVINHLDAYFVTESYAKEGILLVFLLERS
jgi:hypothetical protein